MKSYILKGLPLDIEVWARYQSAFHCFFRCDVDPVERRGYLLRPGTDFLHVVRTRKCNELKFGEEIVFHCCRKGFTSGSSGMQAM